MDVSDVEWRQIDEFPRYFVSNLGEIVGPTGTLTGWITNGYRYVSMNNETGKYKKTVHELVAQQFLGPRRGKYVIHHIDGNRSNNNIRNLMYITNSENTIRGFGLVRYRQKSSDRLNEQAVKVIKWFLKHRRVTVTQLAAYYNVGRATITDIKYGRTWNWVTI